MKDIAMLRAYDSLLDSMAMSDSHHHSLATAEYPPVYVKAVDRIPDDVLHYLFMYCVNIKTEPLQIGFNRVAIGFLADGWLPVILSHVCQAWRNAALASPLLWRRVPMYCTRDNLRHWGATNFIQRAQHMSLELHLVALRTLDARELFILFPQMHRLHRLCLSARGQPLAALVWKQLKFKLPSLREFEFNNVGVHPSQIRMTTDASHTPLLGLARFDLPVTVPPYMIRWWHWPTTRLTSLVLRAPPEMMMPWAAEFRTFFSGAVSLQHLELQGHGVIFEKGHCAPPVILPALRSLVIGYTHKTYCAYSPIILTFRAPGLQTLTLIDLQTHPWILDSPTEFLSRPKKKDHHKRDVFYLLFELLLSCKKLSSLTLVGLKLDAPSLISQMLKQLTQLRSLVLVYSDPLLFKDLAEDFTLPLLSHVTITDFVPLYHLARQRAAAGLPKLEHLTIDLGCLTYNGENGLPAVTLASLARIVSVITREEGANGRRKDVVISMNGIMAWHVWKSLGFAIDFNIYPLVRTSPLHLSCNYVI